MNTVFTLFPQGILTRNNDYLLKLPHCQTEHGKRSFSFVASKIFNDLPLEIVNIP